MSDSTPNVELRRRYTWPWFVAIAVVVGLVICVIAVKREADRVRMQRELQDQFPSVDK
jgi:uncharacterized membrane-anchored protein YhcB (DUF1043 family)